MRAADRIRQSIAEDTGYGMDRKKRAVSINAVRNAIKLMVDSGFQLLNHGPGLYGCKPIPLEELSDKMIVGEKLYLRDRPSGEFLIVIETTIQSGPPLKMRSGGIIRKSATFAFQVEVKVQGNRRGGTVAAYRLEDVFEPLAMVEPAINGMNNYDEQKGDFAAIIDVIPFETRFDIGKQTVEAFRLGTGFGQTYVNFQFQRLKPGVWMFTNYSVPDPNDKNSFGERIGKFTVDELPPVIEREVRRSRMAQEERMRRG